ncbi:MAG TPA: DUF1934 domain-containing protein [Candidatus Merdibacter merdavium]|uniref:DUF1934 domain-containing protein n=1 Tax=Candidatus Merdibacter merdavium TaxID=2838692 RepID=A0A9D2NT23_9FIRM|nr:DUF1934 domain-containing protein [Candidatus Merdibacter merdavium]
MKQDITLIQRHRESREILWQSSGSAAVETTAKSRIICLRMREHVLSLTIYEQAVVLKSVSQLSVTMMFRAGHKTRAHADSMLGTVPLEIYTHSLRQDKDALRIAYDVIGAGAACERFELEVRENQHESDRRRAQGGGQPGCR